MADSFETCQEKDLVPDAPSRGNRRRRGAVKVFAALASGFAAVAFACVRVPWLPEPAEVPAVQEERGADVAWGSLRQDGGNHDADSSGRQMAKHASRVFEVTPKEVAPMKWLTKLFDIGLDREPSAKELEAIKANPVILGSNGRGRDEIVKMKVVAWKDGLETQLQDMAVRSFMFSKADKDGDNWLSDAELGSFALLEARAEHQVDAKIMKYDFPIKEIVTMFEARGGSRREMLAFIKSVYAARYGDMADDVAEKERFTQLDVLYLYCRAIRYEETKDGARVFKQTPADWFRDLIDIRVNVGPTEEEPKLQTVTGTTPEEIMNAAIKSSKTGDKLEIEALMRVFPVADKNRDGKLSDQDERKMFTIYAYRLINQIRKMPKRSSIYKLKAEYLGDKSEMDTYLVSACKLKNVKKKRQRGNCKPFSQMELLRLHLDAKDEVTPKEWLSGLLDLDMYKIPTRRETTLLDDVKFADASESAELASVVDEMTQLSRMAGTNGAGVSPGGSEWKLFVLYLVRIILESAHLTTRLGLEPWTVNTWYFDHSFHHRLVSQFPGNPKTMGEFLDTFCEKPDKICETGVIDVDHVDRARQPGMFWLPVMFFWEYALRPAAPGQLGGTAQ